MRNRKQFKIIVLILTALTGSVSIWAAAGNYKRDISEVSEQILETAADLKQETDKPVLDSDEIKYILDDMKEMLWNYENMLVFAESPYPGEILLGKTPPGNDGWVETQCTSRYEGLVKEIRIRQTGSRARFLRIYEIEVTCMTPNGPEKQVLNKNSDPKLYTGDVFNLTLPKPMRITNIRIHIEHETNGLIISGVPYNMERSRQRMDRSRESREPREVLIGTTRRGNDTWLETICDDTPRPVKEILLKGTGYRAVYLRINDIEITYKTPEGLRKEVFNKSGNIKLYSTGVFRLVLPRPMRVTHIRVLIEHESDGLQVYGIY
jgi:hypothetical protein